jgi:hypothetical protein
VAETTSTTARLAGDRFTPIATLVERPIPAEGLFLPLQGDGYRNCLPLTAACGDSASGLVLIPARTTELTWEPVADPTVLPPRTDLRGIAPLAAVGVAPAAARTSNYALAVLDLTEPGGRLRTFVRSLDALGQLGFVGLDQPIVRPVAGGPASDLGDATSTAAAPFGRPSIRKASSFTEAAPAIPMFAATDPAVIYALRPDNGWGLNLDLIPLLGPTTPFLVRGVDGPPGLYLARPAGLRVPDAAEPAAVSADTSGDGNGSGGPSAVVLLGGAVVLAAAATAGITLVRRRRVDDDG